MASVSVNPPCGGVAIFFQKCSELIIQSFNKDQATQWLGVFLPPSLMLFITLHVVSRPTDQKTNVPFKSVASEILWIQ